MAEACSFDRARRVWRDRLFFPQVRSKKPEHAPLRLAQVERDEGGAVAVVSRLRTVEDDGVRTVEDLSVADRGTPVVRPTHFAGFVSWEHEVGHHDPVTDIYVLGLISSLTSAWRPSTARMEIIRAFDWRMWIVRIILLTDVAAAR